MFPNSYSSRSSWLPLLFSLPMFVIGVTAAGLTGWVFLWTRSIHETVALNVITIVTPSGAPIVDYVLGFFAVVAFLCICSSSLIIYGYFGRKTWPKVQKVRRFSLTLVALGLVAIIMASGSVPVVNATISSTSSAVSSQYSCVKTAAFVETVDNAGSPNTYSISTSGTPTVPCGTLLYGGPGNIGGAVGTNAQQVTQDTIAALAPTGGSISFNQGTFSMASGLLIAGNNVTLTGQGDASCLSFPNNTNGISITGSYDEVTNLCMKAIFPFTSNLIQVRANTNTQVLGVQVTNLIMWAINPGSTFGGNAIQMGTSTPSGVGLQFFNTFNRLYITSTSINGGFKNAILLNASSSPVDDVNSNFFTNISVYPSVQYGITTNNAGGRAASLTGNMFSDDSFEMDGVTKTRCLYIDGDVNIYSNIDCYDTVSSPSQIVVNGAGSTFSNPNYLTNIYITGLGNTTVAPGSFFIATNLGQITEGTGIFNWLGSGSTASVLPSAWGQYTGGLATPTSKVIYTVDGETQLITCSGGTVSSIIIQYHNEVLGTYANCAALPLIALPYSYQINFTYSVAPTVHDWLWS